MTGAELRLWEDLCAQHRVDPAAEGIPIGEKDTKPLDRGLNAVTPVSFASVGGRLTGSAYPCLREPLGEHLTRYREDPFSTESLQALHRMLLPYLAAWGYRPSPFWDRYAVSLLYPSGGVPDPSRILPGTRQLLPGDERTLENRISMKLADCVRRPAFAVIREGRVAAAAVVNRSTDKIRCAEIGVECAPAYRRQGFALSCLTALTAYLMAHGDTALYQHYVTNTASGALALRAGFLPAGAFFAYTSMK